MNQAINRIGTNLSKAYGYGKSATASMSGYQKASALVVGGASVGLMGRKAMSDKPSLKERYKAHNDRINQQLSDYGFKF